VEKEDISSKFPRKLLLFSKEIYSNKIYEIVATYLRENESKRLIWFETDGPAEKVIDKLRQMAIDTSRVYIVDLISKTSGRESGEESHLITNPNDMVEISMTLSDLFDDESVSLAVINTINGLLAFNSEENIKKFIRFLSKIAYSTNSMRKKNQY
jgi:hypothetical protein